MTVILCFENILGISYFILIENKKSGFEIVSVCVCVCLVSCAKAKLIGIQIRFGAVFNVNYSNLCDFNHRSCLSIVSLLGLHGAYDQFFVTVAVFMQAHN